jgi:hypothetical protein
VAAILLVLAAYLAPLVARPFDELVVKGMLGSPLRNRYSASLRIAVAGVLSANSPPAHAPTRPERPTDKRFRTADIGDSPTSFTCATNPEVLFRARAGTGAVPTPIVRRAERAAPESASDTPGTGVDHDSLPGQSSSSGRAAARPLMFTAVLGSESHQRLRLLSAFGAESVSR